MKYVVFTTKHHDGFCMFDTKNQLITRLQMLNQGLPIIPVTMWLKRVFDAFRKEGFLTGAYFQNQTGIMRITGGMTSHQKTGM